jgi:transcriptional regulator with XRE-family HTH domain
MRRNGKLTQQGLADAAGVSRIYIQALEGNRRTPSMKLLHRLAEVLGASVTDIIEDIPNREGRVQLEELFSSGGMEIWYRDRKLSERELKLAERIIAAILDNPESPAP